MSHAARQAAFLIRPVRGNSQNKERSASVSLKRHNLKITILMVVFSLCKMCERNIKLCIWMDFSPNIIHQSAQTKTTPIAGWFLSKHSLPMFCPKFPFLFESCDYCDYSEVIILLNGELSSKQSKISFVLREGSNPSARTKKQSTCVGCFVLAEG